MAWQQPAWADFSGVSRTLQALRHGRSSSHRRCAEYHTACLEQCQGALVSAQACLQLCTQQLAAAQHTLNEVPLTATPHQRPEQPHSLLAQAEAKVATKQRQWTRQQTGVAAAQQRVDRQDARVRALRTQEAALQARLQAFTQANATNLAPVAAVFRLDAGFGTWDNIAFLIEMGYEVYTKPHKHQDSATTQYLVEATATWTPVGANAQMVAWPNRQVKACPYPLDVAVERFQTGKTLRHSVLLHFGHDPVTQDLQGWFETYNDAERTFYAIIQLPRTTNRSQFTSHTGAHQEHEGRSSFARQG